MRPKFIALYSDRPQSGKSTVAQWLVDNRGFIRVPFGEPLKLMCRPLFESLGYGPQEIHKFENGDKKNIIFECDKTVRHIYQSLGTEWGRKLIHPDLWVKAWGHMMLTKILQGGESVKGVVADDCRFLNEWDYVHGIGGQLIEIKRDDAPLPPMHASEGNLRGMAEVIINNRGSVGMLLAQLREIFPE